MATKQAILAVTNDLVTDQRVNKVSESLTQNGFDVLVLGRSLKNSLPLLDKPYRTKRFKLLFTKGAAFYAEINIRIFLFLLIKKADIFVANDLDTLLGVWLAAKLRRKPVVYDSHEYFTEVPELQHNTKAKKTWELIEKLIVPKLRYAMTVCESIAEIYERKYRTAFTVVRNAPKSSQYPNTETNKRKQQIIYQGAVNLGRGLELMIDAMPLIPDAELLIIGGGDILNTLKEKVDKMNLQERITFTGRLNYEALRSYTLNADLGISLEENMGLNYYYALPNKLFDYIHCQVPVLASNLPEIRRIVINYNIGKILEHRTAENLAKLANEMLSDSQARKEWKRNAVKASKELCWEHEEKQLLALYNKVI